MSNESKQEYLSLIKQRYKTSSKMEKHKILDEFCSTCGYHRKYTIRILNTNSEKMVRKKGSGRNKKYLSEELNAFFTQAMES